MLCNGDNWCITTLLMYGGLSAPMFVELGYEYMRSVRNCEMCVDVGKFWMGDVFCFFLRKKKYAPKDVPPLSSYF